MDRPRLIRGLRIAWTAWWGILCVLLIVLWVRSYWRGESVWHVGSDHMLTAFHSQIGVLTLGREPYPGKRHSFEWMYWNWELSRINPAFISQFRYERYVNGVSVNVPHWFLIAVSGVLSTAPWIHWSKRFSLRTLLIATTLIAVLLATAAYLRVL